MPKYFNNAMIGNSKILCTLSDKGEILRLYYPHIDYFQLIDSYSLGILSDNRICWLKDGDTTKQYYDGNIYGSATDGEGWGIGDYQIILDGDDTNNGSYLTWGPKSGGMTPYCVVK